MGQYEEMKGKYVQRRQYNKLVRDKIPEYLESKGVEYKIHIANEEEYWQKLKEKLKEEAEEFSEESEEDALADMLEIIDAICDYKGIDKKKLTSMKQKKSSKRGGFTKRIILEES